MVFYIILGIALLELGLSVVLYRRLITPNQAMLMGMDLLQSQDFSSRLRPGRSRETNRVIHVFNRMMSELKNERLSVREKNHFLDLLLEASPQGIIMLDFDERISFINRAGSALLKLEDPASFIGKTLAELDIELAAVLLSLRDGDDQVVRTPGHSLCRCVRSSFIDRGFNRPFILIEEMTRELMQIEKESYERVIRMMSHEVNNSIGGIGATLDVVAEILVKNQSPEWTDVLQAVEASGERSRSLGEFVNKLADVVRIPNPVFAKVSVNELLRSADAFSRIECRNRNIDLCLSLLAEDIVLEADGIQLEQVLVNIIKNAYESIGKEGNIRISVSENPLVLSVADNGPGISPEVRDKLFVPFFTTKHSGQGIGLTMIREVLFNHGFRFSLTTENDWTTFRIYCDVPDK